MIEHMRDKHIRCHKVAVTDFAFERTIGVVRFKVASKMSGTSITFLAILDDASVVSRRRNLVGASMTTFQARAF